MFACLPPSPSLVSFRVGKDGVKLVLNARTVTVTGTRGSLTRSFKHRNMEMTIVDGGKKLRVDIWFGLKKQLASLRTCCSHIENMITGVTKVCVCGTWSGWGLCVLP